MDKLLGSAPDRRRWLHQVGRWAMVGASGSLGACASLRPAASPEGEASEPEHPAVQPFSSGLTGGHPAGWHPYAMRRDLTPTRYRLVQGHAGAVLHAHAQSAATGLRCPVRISPQQRPMLNFSWRVQHAPDHATVEAPELDDCPARVIVAFDGDTARLSLRDRLLFDQVELFTGQRLPFAMLMYVWDGQLPPETLTRNHRTARIQYLTVESGDRHVGQWRTHRRDLVADYQRAFGEAPGEVISVGVLTDGDALKLDLQAWYGDISLQPRS